MNLNFRQALNFSKALFIVWIWEPIQDIWNSFLIQMGIRNCCASPDLFIYDVFRGGFARCRNCKREWPFVSVNF